MYKKNDIDILILPIIFCFRLVHFLIPYSKKVLQIVAFFYIQTCCRNFLWPRSLRKRNLMSNSTEIRKKRRRKQDKWRLSPKQPKLKHTFFILLFSSLIPSGLLSSLNKHKNDCHNAFFIYLLFFLSFLMVSFFFMRIYRRRQRKCRYQASEQGELTIPC